MENCCIWLVIYLNCTMMHGLTNLKSFILLDLLWVKMPEHETDRSHQVMMLTTGVASLPAQYVTSRPSAWTRRQTVRVAHLQQKR
jgi:hypothetical protein